jgi:hypothetical protein
MSANDELEKLMVGLIREVVRNRRDIASGTDLASAVVSVTLDSPGFMDMIREIPSDFTGSRNTEESRLAFIIELLALIDRKIDVLLIKSKSRSLEGIPCACGNEVPGLRPVVVIKPSF